MDYDDFVNLMSTVQELDTKVNRMERKVYRDEKKVEELPLSEEVPANQLTHPIFSPYLQGPGGKQ